jgi:hypothetical protein
MKWRVRTQIWGEENTSAWWADSEKTACRSANGLPTLLGHSHPSYRERARNCGCIFGKSNGFEPASTCGTTIFSAQDCRSHRGWREVRDSSRREIQTQAGKR